MKPVEGVGGRRERNLMIIDGSYFRINSLRKPSLPVNEQAMKNFFNEIERKLNLVLDDVFYFDASRGGTQSSFERHYTSVLQACNVQLVLKNYKSMSMKCPNCSHQFSRRVQAEVDVAIASKIVYDHCKERFDNLILIAGDGDFKEALDKVRNDDSNKRVYILAWRRSISPKLQEKASRNCVLYFDDHWNDFVPNNRALNSSNNMGEDVKITSEAEEIETILSMGFPKAQVMSLFQKYHDMDKVMRVLLGEDETEDDLPEHDHSQFNSTGSNSGRMGAMNESGNPSSGNMPSRGAGGGHHGRGSNNYGSNYNGPNAGNANEPIFNNRTVVRQDPNRVVTSGVNPFANPNPNPGNRFPNNHTNGGANAGANMNTGNRDSNYNHSEAHIEQLMVLGFSMAQAREGLSASSDLNGAIIYLLEKYKH
eukprot:CAMPEP_0114982122 /NCGR_PEP_ID=MMETSP0216-20121206/5920_1 /TAXON_ID=223996 /ORGANISM="Protocruzia adherens, Strain Boccale" /LENGTH=422 /DNA_ID=CAMNT_0002343861 /DNA_START=294 /DNA_END=1562 /DNA_ORIENTATION=-